MQAIVLGAAAGGGFPQWNCRCRICDEAWNRRAQPRTQSGLAVSADGKSWLLLNASPDLRQQILATEALHPPPTCRRGSPIAAVILTNGDVDHIAGLLSLREGHHFHLYATTRVLGILEENPIFNVLPGDRVTRRPLTLDSPFEMEGPGGTLGLRAVAFRVPGKVPLYLEERQDGLELDGESEDVIGLSLEADGRRLCYVPGCARLSDQLLHRICGADCLLFDGTLWRDNEMTEGGLGEKSGRRMGHVSISGPQGSLSGLADADVPRRVYIHVNNTNPVLLADTPEHRKVLAAGWEIANDGMVIEL